MSSRSALNVASEVSGFGDRRRVVGRGGREGEHLAGLRIEHHDGAATAAERLDGRPLQIGRERQGQVLRVVSIGTELRERVAHRIGHEARQLGVVCALETRPPVSRGGIADDLARRGGRIHAIELAVRIGRVAGQDLAVAIEDPASGDRPGGRDDRRVVRGTHELRSLDHAPVADRTGKERESGRQHDRDVDRGPAERSSTADVAEHHVARPRRTRRQREPTRGGGGGSTPLSDSASSSPMTSAFARIDEPP